MKRADPAGYVAGVHERTRLAVAAIPPGLTGSRPTAGGWSLAELVAHIANARVWNAAGVAGEQAAYGGHEPDDGSLPSLLALLDRASRECLRILDSVDLWDGQAVTSQGKSTPAWERLLGGLVEHEVHHRAQLTAELRAAGGEAVPLFGLFEEDLPGQPDERQP